MVSPISGIPPSDPDAKKARELNRLFSDRGGRLRLNMPLGNRGKTIELPATAVQLLQQILCEMAEGNAVAVVPVRTELTTQQAADFLGVSRPFLIKLLRNKRIPHRKVGSHRRILLHDVIQYKQRTDAQRHEVLDQLVAEAQELKMGY